jgi:hypothetical protein
MSQKPPKSLENLILSTLDNCIGKMAEKLNKAFSPESNDSLRLFKQFCSALNARKNWLKSMFDKNNVQKVELKSTNKKQTKQEPTKFEKCMNEISQNNDLNPSNRTNGLLRDFKPVHS